MMETKETNELIAMFMELPIGKYPSVDGKGYWETSIGDISRANADLLLYHESWDWLMPVVEKIEALGYPVIMRADKNGSSCIIYNIWNDGSTKISGQCQAGNREGPKQEVVHNASLKFIKWYNNQ